MCILVNPEVISSLLKLNLSCTFGYFGGLRFAEFLIRVKIADSVSSSKPSQDKKKSINTIILTEIRFIYLKLENVDWY